MDLVDKIFSFIAPYECLACSAQGPILCEACTEAEIVQVINSCIGCKKLSANGKTCANCRSSFPIDALWAACSYGPLAKQIVKEYKYNSKRGIAEFMTTQMLDVLPEAELLVTSVPTSSIRIRQRGFDHAARLAKTLANKARLPYSPLLRRLNNSHQVGSSRKKRIEQAEKLFLFGGTTDISGKDILIVDDVVTTGASISAATRVLKKAGAKNVYGLVFARKV